MTYPDLLEIQPLERPPHATVRVPGSKSITNRALILGALRVMDRADPEGGPFTLDRPLESEDTQVMLDSLARLGFKIEADWNTAHPSVLLYYPFWERYRLSDRAELFVANSGTSMRFLTAFACLGTGRYRLDGVARMRERPIQDLLDALRQLGVHAFSEAGNGCPPVVIESRGLPAGRVRIKGDISSQFLSGLLMAAPGAKGPITIEVEGRLVSWPYVSMTIEMMKQFGCRVTVVNEGQFVVRPGFDFGIDSWTVEPDASAASYFFAAAALTGGRVTVEGLSTKSLQGDIRFVDVLEDMGCQVVRGDTNITVAGGPLHGIDVDMNDISDTVMTLGAVACFAQGPTTIRNVGHIRHKETDRLSALATELRRVGAHVEETADGLTITPAPLHAAAIETYHDHRMAMSLALVGLRIPGIVIKNPACVGKTYPRFFEDLEKLRCWVGK